MKIESRVLYPWTPPIIISVKVEEVPQTAKVENPVIKKTKHPDPKGRGERG